MDLFPSRRALPTSLILLSILAPARLAGAGFVLFGTSGQIDAQYYANGEYQTPLYKVNGSLPLSLPQTTIATFAGRDLATADGAGTYASSSSFVSADTAISLHHLSLPSEGGLLDLESSGRVSFVVHPDPHTKYYASGGFSTFGHVAPGYSIQVMTFAYASVDFGHHGADGGHISIGIPGIDKTFTSGDFSYSAFESPTDIGDPTNLSSVDYQIYIYVRRSVGAPPDDGGSWVTVDPGVGLADSPSLVPEPSSFAMTLSASVVCLIAHLRRSRAQAGAVSRAPSVAARPAFGGAGGRVTRKRVPRPGDDSKSIVPPWSLTIP